MVRTEGELPTQEVVAEGEDGPTWMAKHSFSTVLYLVSLLRASDLDTAPAAPLPRPPGPGRRPAPLSDASVCNKKGRSKVRRVQERAAAQGSLYFG